jgi:hypothetical protein
VPLFYKISELDPFNLFNTDEPGESDDREADAGIGSPGGGGDESC